MRGTSYEVIWLYRYRVWYAVLFGWRINRRKHPITLALDMGYDSRHLDIGFNGNHGDGNMYDKTLDYGLSECDLCELLLWLERSEETGYYMGYSRHAIAMAYTKRMKKLSK